MFDHAGHNIFHVYRGTEGKKIREKKIVETFEYFCLLPLQYMVYVGILCVFELKYG